MDKIIVVEPENPQNTGFIARLAENFKAEIKLVNPNFNLSEARKTANKSQKKLREAKIYSGLEKAIRDLDHVIGTKPGKGIALKDFRPCENTSLVVGRESSGLTEEELDRCDATVHIETGEYSSINQSHAAAILMHSINSRENQKADLKALNALKDEAGDKTLELLKRASPTEREARAVISEFKSEKN